MLKPGDILDGQSGMPVTVGKELGTGGQGEIYEARLKDGSKVAVKWFLPAYQQPDLRASITALVEDKAPSAHFLWPDDIVTKGGEFGYVMRLRPAHFASFTMVLGRKVNIRASVSWSRAGGWPSAEAASHDTSGPAWTPIPNLFTAKDSGRRGVLPPE